MKSRFFRILILLPLFLNLVSCASVYQGAGPDLTLKGKDAQNEIKKFSFEESYWQQGRFVKMGPEGNLYTIDSVKPVMAQVSPRSVQTLESAEKWRTAGLVSLGFAAAALIVNASTNDSAVKNSTLTAAWVGIGAAWVTIFVYPAKMSGAAQEYNQDLRQKFTPGVALNFRY